MTTSNPSLRNFLTASGVSATRLSLAISALITPIFISSPYLYNDLPLIPSTHFQKAQGTKNPYSMTYLLSRIKTINLINDGLFTIMSFYYRDNTQQFSLSNDDPQVR